MTKQNPLEDNVLAINGGTPIRGTSMPARHALGPDEEAMIHEVIAHYRGQGLDPGYDGEFEARYCRDIEDFMGGGYADAVNSGTAAIYVALMALELPQNSEILVSPITDAGSIGPIVVSGLRPKIIDSKARHYNVDAEQVFRRVTNQTRAILIVHATGQPVTDIEEIVFEAHKRDIRVLEDTSQAIGATVNGHVVGSFGDIAAWSSGSRKIQITGGSGGVIFSKDRDLMAKAVAYADRGKPKFDPNFEDRNPSTYIVPGLNLNADEIACSIGIASLKRLPQTIERRLAFVRAIDTRLQEATGGCSPYGFTDGDSPFFQPVILEPEKYAADKTDFAVAVQAEGIGLNPDYKFLVADWSWLKPYLVDDTDTPNARWIRDHSFNIFVNENYTEREADDTLAAIQKVEQAYRG